MVWPQGPLPARWAAMRVLVDRRLSTLAAREALELLVERGELSATETPLATELVMGVLRHRLTLVRVVGQMTSNGWPRVDPLLRPILLIGGYQLIWLDGRKGPVSSLLLDELIPLSRYGLGLLGIDAPDRDHYLGIVKARVNNACTGANWQRAYVARHGNDMQGLTEAYYQRQQSGLPVHEWDS